MAITYNITTNFGAKDTLPSGDSNKIIRGSEFTTEFTNIKTAFGLAAPVASPTFTGTATIPTAAVTAFTLGGTTVTATAAELNLLDGVTATTAELNYVDGVTSNVQTQLDAKAPLASPTFTGTATIPTAAVTTFTLGGTTVTATAAELNILDGVTATASELNTLDGITATVTELNYVDGVTSNVQTQLDAKVAKAAAVFDGSVEEQEYNLTGTAIDPANGTIQYKTLSANTTFTESLSNGEYVTLMIDDGTGYTVTWPTTTWVGGSAPTLETTGYNVIEIWKVNSILYGAFVGAA